MSKRKYCNLDVLADISKQYIYFEQIYKEEIYIKKECDRVLRSSFVMAEAYALKSLSFIRYSQSLVSRAKGNTNDAYYIQLEASFLEKYAIQKFEKSKKIEIRELKPESLIAQIGGNETKSRILMKEALIAKNNAEKIKYQSNSPILKQALYIQYLSYQIEYLLKKSIVIRLDISVIRVDLHLKEIQFKKLKAQYILEKFIKNNEELYDKVNKINYEVQELKQKIINMKENAYTIENKVISLNRKACLNYNIIRSLLK